MLILLRRVVGSSMSPKLRPGQLIIAWPYFKRLHPGQVVIITHDDKEKVKRVERIEDNKIFVIGDNIAASIDSRHFGWLGRPNVVARVIWPNLAK